MDGRKIEARLRRAVDRLLCLVWYWSIRYFYIYSDIFQRIWSETVGIERGKIIKWKWTFMFETQIIYISFLGLNLTLVCLAHCAGCNTDTPALAGYVWLSAYPRHKSVRKAPLTSFFWWILRFTQPPWLWRCANVQAIWYHSIVRLGYILVIQYTPVDTRYEEWDTTLLWLISVLITLLEYTLQPGR